MLPRMVQTLVAAAVSMLLDTSACGDPVYTPPAAQTANEGVKKAFDLGSFTDDDSGNGPWTVHVLWGDGHRSGISVEAPGSIGSMDYRYADDGDYSGTVTVFGSNGGSDSAAFPVTVANIAPRVYASSYKQNAQYSDAINPVVIKAYDVPADRSSLDATSAFTFNGGSSNPGLPSGLSLAPDGALAATWNLTGTANVDPGAYILRVSVADNDGGSSSRDISLVVKPENAAANYTGTTYVNSGLLDLRAGVVEVNDGSPGDVSNAMVNFVIRETGQVLAQDVAVTLDDPGDTTAGTASTTAQVDIGLVAAKTFTIGTVITNNYTGNTTVNDSILTIAKPISNLVSAGGFVINNDDTFGGTDGLRTNFGLFARYSDSGISYGRVNLLIRNTGQVFQVRCSALDSLFTDVPGGTADMGGVASIVDITDRTHPLTLTNNGFVNISIDGLAGNDRVAVDVFDGFGDPFFSTGGFRVLDDGDASVR